MLPKVVDKNIVESDHGGPSFKGFISFDTYSYI